MSEIIVSVSEVTEHIYTSQQRETMKGWLPVVRAQVEQYKERKKKTIPNKVNIRKFVTYHKSAKTTWLIFKVQILLSYEI